MRQNEIYEVLKLRKFLSCIQSQFKNSVSLCENLCG